MSPSWQAPEVTLAPPLRDEDLVHAGRFGVVVAAARDPAGWQLVRSADRMTLHSPAGPGAFAIELSLASSPLVRRLRTSRRSDPLPRALGLGRRPEPPSVVDATAGLCRDAMVLAHLGCAVRAIERVPALAFLAHDAVLRAGFGGALSVISTDAVTWLHQLPAAEAPDAIYLDPMFEDSGRAQVKKEMQAFRALAGKPDDGTALFSVARAVARERVVVKRHANLPALAPGVSFVVEGERVRFDVYLAAAPTRAS